MGRIQKEGGDALMALFRTDLEAFFYVLVIGLSIYLVNRLISYSISRIKKILPASKNKINFVEEIKEKDKND